MPTDENHSNCDCIDGSIVDGFREPILFSFGWNKLPGFKLFNEPDTRWHKKTVLIGSSSYLEGHYELQIDI